MTLFFLPFFPINVIFTSLTPFLILLSHKTINLSINGQLLVEFDDTIPQNLNLISLTSK